MKILAVDDSRMLRQRNIELISGIPGIEIVGKAEIWLGGDGIVRQTYVDAVSHVLSTFFIGINKPKVPTMLFTNESIAIQWLNDQQ